MDNSGHDVMNKSDGKHRREGEKREEVSMGVTGTGGAPSPIHRLF